MYVVTTVSCNHVTFCKLGA